jgi:hypothetical protein
MMVMKVVNGVGRVGEVGGPFPGVVSVWVVEPLDEVLLLVAPKLGIEDGFYLVFELAFDLDRGGVGPRNGSGWRSLRTVLKGKYGKRGECEKSREVLIYK